MKKLLLNTSIATVAMMPIIGLVSCSDSNKKGTDAVTAMTVTISESQKTNLISKIAEFNKSKTDELATEINTILSLENLVTKDSTITLSANGELLNVIKTAAGQTLKFAVTINYDDSITNATITIDKSVFVSSVLDFINSPTTDKARLLNNILNQDELIRSDSTLSFNDTQSVLKVINPTADGQTTETMIGLIFHVTTTGVATVNYNKLDFESLITLFNNSNTDASYVNAALTLPLTTGGVVVTASSHLTLSEDKSMLSIENTAPDGVISTLEIALTYHMVITVDKISNDSKSHLASLITAFKSSPSASHTADLNTSLNLSSNDGFIITTSSDITFNQIANTLTVETTENGVQTTATINLKYTTEATTSSKVASNKVDFETKVTTFTSAPNADNANAINAAIGKNGLVTATSTVTLSPDKATLLVVSESSTGALATTVSLTYNVTLPAITKTLNSTNDAFKALVDAFNSTKTDDNANALNTALDLTSTNDGFVVTTTSTVGLNPNKTTLTVENTVDGLTTTRTINLVYLVILDTANISSTKEAFKTQVTTFTTTPSINNANAINAAIGNGLVIATNSTVTLTSDGLTLTVENTADGVTTTTIITLTYSIAASNTATVSSDKNAFKTKVDTYIATKNKTNADAINTAISQPGLITATSDVTLSSNGLTLTVTNIVDDVTTTTTITLTYSIAASNTATVSSDKNAFKTKVNAFNSARNSIRANEINTAISQPGLIITASIVTLSSNGLTLTVMNTDVDSKVRTTTTITLTYSIAASDTATVSSDKNAFKTKVDTYIATKNKTNADAINTAISQPGLITATSTVTLNDTTLTVVNTADDVTTTTTITLTYSIAASATATVSSDKNAFKTKVDTYIATKNKTNADAINTAISQPGLITATSDVTLSSNGLTLTVVNTANSVTTTTTITITYSIAASATATVSSDKNAFKTKVNAFNSARNSIRANEINTAISQPGLIITASIVTLSSNGLTLTVMNTDVDSKVRTTTTITLTYSIAASDTATVSSDKNAFKTKVDTYIATKNKTNADAINTAISQPGLITATSDVTLSSNGLTLTIVNTANSVTTTTTITITYSIAASATATVSSDKNAFKTKVDTYIATKNKTNADAINTAISQPGLITATSDVTLSSNGLTLTVVNTANSVTTTTTITLTYSIAASDTATVTSDKNAFKTLVDTYIATKNKTNADAINTAISQPGLITATSTVTLNDTTLTVVNTANSVTTTTTITITYTP